MVSAFMLCSGVLSAILAFFLWRCDLYKRIRSESDTVTYLPQQKYHCNPGSFILDGMTDCHSWLTCNEIKSPHISIKQIIGTGAVKTVSYVHFLL